MRGEEVGVRAVGWGEMVELVRWRGEGGGVKVEG